MEPSRSLPEVVYTADSTLRKPKQLLTQMVKDLLASRELAWRFFLRNIRTRYRRSLLGPLWTFIPPLVTALTFTLLRSTGVVEIGETNIPYPLYVMFGMVLWQLFLDSLNLPLRAMKSGQALIKTIKLPIEALILAAMGEMLFDRGVQILILAVFFLIFRVPVDIVGTLLSPLPMLLLLLLGIGLGLWLVPIGALYSDVSSAIPLVTRLWFFLTPVIYPPPTNWPYSLLSDLNPVSPPLSAARDLVILGKVENPLMLGIVTLITLAVVAVGWVLYRLSVPILIERSS